MNFISAIHLKVEIENIFSEIGHLICWPDRFLIHPSGGMTDLWLTRQAA